jgi:glycosyltransferase involved in cell wall biosynthesis
MAGDDGKGKGKQMNILMVTSAFPPYFGGAAVQATYLAQGLKARGVDVEFITDNEERPSVRDIYKGIRVYRCSSFFDNMAMTGKRSELIFTLRILLYVIRNWRRYDVIHFHSIRGWEALIFPLLKLMGKKLIYKFTLVGSDDPMAFKRRNFMAPAYLWGLSFVDKYIAIASVQADLTEEAGLQRERVLHLPNGVDTRRYAAPEPDARAALKSELGFSQYDKIFYSIGKIEDRKNYKFLLRAWKILSRQYPNSAIVFAGTGNTEDSEYYRELLQMIDDDQLPGVVFLGHRDNVDDYMKISDAFLFASKAEGFGTVLIEAAVTGVPVVARNIEGVTEDILLPEDHDLARICYEDDAEAFAAMTIDLLGNYDQAGRARSIARFQRVYGLEHITSRYVDLYQKLLGEQ